MFNREYYFYITMEQKFDLKTDTTSWLCLTFNTITAPYTKAYECKNDYWMRRDEIFNDYFLVHLQ